MIPDHVVKCLWYFSQWKNLTELFSLPNIMRFIHVTCTNSSFFFVGEYITSCGYSMICLSVHLWIDIWIVSSLGILQTKMLWAFACVVLLSSSVVSDSLRLQPTVFLCPWDSPGKNVEWAAMPSSRGSSWPRDQTRVSCIAGGFFTHWAPREGLCWIT